MSDGARLSLMEAQAAAACVAQLWGMTTPDVLLVGSTRRQRPTVGDLEFTCRRPADDEPDELFSRMVPHIRIGGLFAGTADDDKIGDAVKGFRSHFAYCDMLLNLHEPCPGGRELVVRVQIHRWDPDGLNRGWIELMRTGPAEFGEWYLRAWKRRWNIHGAGRASIDGRLVDAGGRPVPTRTEAECFRLCGLNYIEPDRRDAFAEHQAASRRVERAWQHR